LNPDFPLACGLILLHWVPFEQFKVSVKPEHGSVLRREFTTPTMHNITPSDTATLDIIAAMKTETKGHLQAAASPFLRFLLPLLVCASASSVATQQHTGSTLQTCTDTEVTLPKQPDGWMKAAECHRPAEMCTIPRVQSLTAADFDMNYRDMSPVIVANGAVDWPALTQWTPEYLSQAIGEHGCGFGGSLVSAISIVKLLLRLGADHFRC
jgi:hypothetical protein